MIHELSIELAPSTLQHVGCPKSDSSTTRSRRVWFPQTADQHHQEGGIRNQAETCDHRLLSSRLTGRGAGVVALDPPQALTISVGSGPDTISASTIRVSEDGKGGVLGKRLSVSVDLRCRSTSKYKHQKNIINRNK